MKLCVSEEIAQRYPDLRIGFIVAEGLSNRGEDAELAEDTRAAAASVRERFADAAQLTAHPYIAAWREVYRSFGAKPSRYRPSAEALLRRVVKGDSMPSINKAVDAYLLPELHYLLPVGGYDLAALRGDIHLRRSAGGETFVGIGSDEEATDPGEVVYSDDAAVLTRRWNYRDCHHARITEASTDIALFVEAPLAEISTEDVRGLIAMIADRVQRACGGTLRTGMLEVEATRDVAL